MTTPEFLYFDLGKVLLTFDHPRMLRQMAAVADVSVEAVRTAIMPCGEPTVGDPQWRLEAGTLSIDGYYEHLCESLGVRPPREELWRAASDIFAPIEASMDLLERLHAAGHRLGLLSNTSPVHWDFFMDGRFPTLTRVFEIPLGSFHAGTMKPDPAIYHYAAEKAGVSPQRVFFTDDRADNVEGARACGLDAVLFTDTAQLESDLRARGLGF
jgi:putative hydrolase of the HAD superfamily